VPLKHHAMTAKIDDRNTLRNVRTHVQSMRYSRLIAKRDWANP
jgi:hypothetical protein